MSVAGHDKGMVLCVLEQAGDFLLLANGRQRKVTHPKRKKLKHVEFIDVAAYSGPMTNKAIHAYIRDNALPAVKAATN